MFINFVIETKLIFVKLMKIIKTRQQKSYKKHQKTLLRPFQAKRIMTRLMPAQRFIKKPQMILLMSTLSSQQQCLWGWPSQTQTNGASKTDPNAIRTLVWERGSSSSKLIHLLASFSPAFFFEKASLLEKATKAKKVRQTGYPENQKNPNI